MTETQTRWLTCGERQFKVILGDERPEKPDWRVTAMVQDMNDPDQPVTIERLAPTQEMTFLMVKNRLQGQFGECDEVGSQEPYSN